MNIPVLSLAAGISLGIFYFLGLWLTLKKLPQTQQPVLLTMGSFFIRMAVCLFSFYLVVRMADLEGLAWSIAGFISMKFLLVSRLGGRQNGRNKP